MGAAEADPAAAADALALHLLARSQGVAALANAIHDETFVRREAEAMCARLRSCAESAAPAAAPSNPD